MFYECACDDIVRAQRLFVDIPGGITVLPAITPNPAGDTDPSTLPKLPTPDSAPPTQPEAKQEKGGKVHTHPLLLSDRSPFSVHCCGVQLKAGKGVAFSGGDEKDGEDESDAAAAAALAKKVLLTSMRPHVVLEFLSDPPLCHVYPCQKKKKPPVPSWSTSASERGYLLAAAGVVGPAGLLRVFHAPPSHEHNQPWRLLAHATVPDPIASLTFSPDSRCV